MWAPSVPSNSPTDLSPSTTRTEFLPLVTFRRISADLLPNRKTSKKIVSPDVPRAALSRSPSWSRNRQVHFFFWFGKGRRMLGLLRAVVRVQSVHRARTLGICHFSTEAADGSGPIGAVEPQMSASFVCNACESRGTWTFKRKTYEKGVVLVRCKSCDNLHLVADNLGWFRDNKTNLESLALEKGQTINRAQRVQFQTDAETWEQIDPQSPLLVTEPIPEPNPVEKEEK